MADIDEARRMSFDRQAEQYDAARPSYPETAIEALLARSGIAARGRILEVGAGTGKATVPLARLGYPLVAIEPGPHMAAVLRRHVARYPNVTIAETTFEAWTGADGSFDLLVSATAFHWIRPEVRCRKAADALRPGGGLALLTTERGELDPEVRAGLDRAYAAWFPGAQPRVPGYGEDKTRERMEEIAASGFFEPAEVRTFPWSASYTSQTYVALMDTYSDHAVQPAQVRVGLYREVTELIEQRGGAFEIPYRTVVVCARRLGNR